MTHDTAQGISLGRRGGCDRVVMHGLSPLEMQFMFLADLMLAVSLAESEEQVLLSEATKVDVIFCVYRKVLLQHQRVSDWAY